MKHFLRGLLALWTGEHVLWTEHLPGFRPPASLPIHPLSTEHCWRPGELPKVWKSAFLFFKGKRKRTFQRPVSCRWTWTWATSWTRLFKGWFVSLHRGVFESRPRTFLRSSGRRCYPKKWVLLIRTSCWFGLKTVIPKIHIVFRHKVCKDVIDLKRGRRLSPNPTRLLRRGGYTQTHMEERPCDDTPPTSPGETPQQTPAQRSPSSQHCAKITFSSFSHLSAGLCYGNPGKLIQLLELNNNHAAVIQEDDR